MSAPNVSISKYEEPEFETGKRVVMLGRSDLVSFGVQVIKKGGETNLHTHPGNDAYWFVLNGHARFYGEGDVVVADIQKHEGVLIPRGFKYWFESVGDETLEIIRAGAQDPRVRGGRVDYAPMTEATKDAYAAMGKNAPGY